jgi:hypothetical protein
MRRLGILIVLAMVVGQAEAGHCRRRSKRTTHVVPAPAVYLYTQCVPVLPNPPGPTRVIEPIPPTTHDVTFPPMASPQHRR